MVLPLKALAIKYLVSCIWTALDDEIHDWEPPVDGERNLGVADGRVGLIQNDSLLNYRRNITAINDYLKLSTGDLKKDIVHVMKSQYNAKLLNVLHMVFMIEMGFDQLSIKGRVYSRGAILVDLLSQDGRMNIKKMHLVLKDGPEEHKSAHTPNQFVKTIETFNNLREITDHCGCTTDGSLKTLAENLQHLEKLDIYFSKITDVGISHLTASASMRNSLISLNLQDTLISSDGIMTALDKFTKLANLDCVNPKSMMSALPPHALIFSTIKNLSLTVAAQTWTENSRHRMPFLFPNLEKFSFNFLPKDDTRFFSLVFLSRLQHLTTLELLVYNKSLQLKIFTCRNVLGAVGTNGLFQMHNVRKLRLFGFNHICVCRILKIWPKLSYLTIANSLHCKCPHRDSSNANGLGESVKHVNLVCSSPLCYLTCFPNLKTMALTIEDGESLDVGVEVMGKLSRRLTHVSLICQASLLGEMLNKWLKYCDDLRVLNLSHEHGSLAVVKRFVVMRRNVQVTFEDLYGAMSKSLELWFKQETFTPCSLCRAYGNTGSNSMNSLAL